MQNLFSVQKCEYKSSLSVGSNCQDVSALQKV